MERTPEFISAIFFRVLNVDTGEKGGEIFFHFKEEVDEDCI